MERAPVEQWTRIGTLVLFSLRLLANGEQPSKIMGNLSKFAQHFLNPEERLLLTASFFETLSGTDQRDFIEEAFWAIKGVEWPLAERDKKRLAWAWNRADNDVRGQFISAIGAAA